MEQRSSNGEKAIDAITVAELARRLKRSVEAATGREWVEGEVTSLRAAASGHFYFCLKDEREDAVIDCVIYRSNALRARRFLVDGARLHVLGRATVWAPRGKLQFVAEAARPAGRGAILAALEAVREKLKAEGLFDPARKRPLPPEPRIVGIVTSAHGAALHDIVTVAFRRGGVRLVLASALVQGDGAPASLVAALDRLSRYPGLEVVIIGRGGGSNDDLGAFNDERVVRRVAAMSVPVVSAVGHEVDITLTDFAADVRAATPSQAAELVVPDTRARLEVIARAKRALVRAVGARLREDGHLLGSLRNSLADPRFVIADKQQHLDELLLRLERRTERSLVARRSAADALASRLAARHPRAVVARARGDLGPVSERLGAALRLHIEEARGRLGGMSSRLDAMSPLAVLSRGYAIATRADGRAVRRASEVREGDELTLRLHEGTLGVAVRSARETSDER